MFIVHALFPRMLPFSDKKVYPNPFQQSSENIGCFPSSVGKHREVASKNCPGTNENCSVHGLLQVLCIAVTTVYWGMRSSPPPHYICLNMRKQHSRDNLISHILKL